MSTRDQLFARLIRGREPDLRESERAALHDRLAKLAFGGGSADIDLFLRRAREAGSDARRCTSRAEAADWLSSHAAPGTRCILSDDAIFLDMGLRERLVHEGWELRSVKDESLSNTSADARRLYADADIGVTVALAGLADSGAILLSSSQNESRSVSLLAVEHVALLPAGRILPSLLQAAPMLRALAGPDGTSAATLVGGPSKTADIEKVLVTGVHGPAVLTIIVIDDEK